MQNKHFQAVLAELKHFYGYKYSKIIVLAFFSLVVFYDLYLAVNQVYDAEKEVFIYGETNSRPLTVNIRKDIISRIEKRLEAREEILNESLAKTRPNPFLPYSSANPFEQTAVP